MEIEAIPCECVTRRAPAKYSELLVAQYLLVAHSLLAGSGARWSGVQCALSTDVLYLGAQPVMKVPGQHSGYRNGSGMWIWRMRSCLRHPDFVAVFRFVICTPEMASLQVISAAHH